MRDKDLLLGDFYSTNTLEGYTLIKVNKGGYTLFEGRYLDLPIKYHKEVIKHLYIEENILYIDLKGE